ncbi:1-acyl-sn-glycerol-3-phosphate acyltransferase alpha-like [Sceloporus undulatus]|uniref:1-acyl-sn-glycerol-3-phosphate acyltransferase alpha-like n=1 Tax=Sceloporus undulatus TaxID=8520 RepID=UPI001C4C9E0A|nr:1-acyl-sn-glycerol-3-phosphate acyltransferase alpha-like [Sceloporus undulatus]
MAQSLILINFILFFFAAFLLYRYSNIFRYYFRIHYINGWMFLWSIVLVPVLVLRGRNVANMKILRFVMLPLKYIIGIKINVQDATYLNLKGPYVIVANHQSNVDFLGMFQILPDRCTLLVKKEILYYFTVGIVSWLSGFIFIDRKKKDATIKVMSGAADSIVRDNLRIWIFPEGTRSYSTTILPFKSGAFHLAVKTQVPIIPVVMSSYLPFFNTKLKKFSTGEVTIKILPPVKTEGLSPTDVPELTERVRETMLSTFHELPGSPGKQSCSTKEDACQGTSGQDSS